MTPLRLRMMEDLQNRNLCAKTQKFCPKNARKIRTNDTRIC